MALTPEVAAAIDELRRAHPRTTLTVRDDGQGGAYVTLAPLPLGSPYAQGETWMGFQVSHLYPQADVYPHHVRGDLSRLDGAGLGAATGSSSFEGRSSVQLSRRSNRRDAAADTALLKMERILAWLRSK